MDEFDRDTAEAALEALDEQLELAHQDALTFGTGFLRVDADGITHVSADEARALAAAIVSMRVSQ